SHAVAAAGPFPTAGGAEPRGSGEWIHRGATERSSSGRLRWEAEGPTVGARFPWNRRPFSAVCACDRLDTARRGRATVSEQGTRTLSTRSQQFIDAARQVAGGADVRDVVGQSLQQMGGGAAAAAGEGFGLNQRDFPAARGEGSSAGTRIASENVSLDDSAEKLSRSHFEMGPNGPVHVITPMVMPKGRKLRAMLPVITLIIVGAVGSIVLLPFDGLRSALFGVHYWILVLLIAAFMWWRQGMVMVPERCTALASRLGKVEGGFGPGRVTLWNRWKRVSCFVNTTRESPFNAPIRQAPTKSGVQAAVDLFLQFRIVNAREFVFVLGAVQGFQDKLNNAISETTR